MEQRIIPSSQIKMLHIQKDFLEAIQKIYQFFYEKKENIEAKKKALEALEDMRGKFSDMLDIYNVSFENFPGLPDSLSRNSDILKRNFGKIQGYIAHGIEVINCYEFIYTHCNEITEQYIRIAIEGLYIALNSQALPSLPSIRVKEALTFSIVNLEDFFRKIIIEPSYLAKVLEELKMTEIMLLSQPLEEETPDPKSTYLVLIAGLFSNFKTIHSLDLQSQEDIAKSMFCVLSLVQKESFPTNDKLAFQKIKSPILPNIPSNLLPAYLTFSGLFHTCAEISTISKKIDAVKTILSKMYGVYGKNPDDFSGFPEILLEDARSLKDRCQNCLLEGKPLIKELDIFHHQMTRRCFQMQICTAYNDSISMVDKSLNYEAPWEKALTSVTPIIVEMCQKTGPSKKAEKFIFLKELLLWKERPLPAAIAAAQQCIIAIDHLFQNSPAILQLSPKLLEKIIETFEQLLALLENMLATSLSGGESEIYQPERMQMFSNKPSQLEQVSAENFKIQYPIVNIILSPFSFFSLKKSSDAALRKNAELYWLVCKNVRGDGNCLFTAVAFYLKCKFPQIYQSYSLAELAEYLRQQTTEHMRNNRNKYEAFMEDNQKFDDYLKIIGKSGKWAGETELRALATILTATIIVIRSDDTQPTVLRNQMAKDNIICLGYEAPSHYQLLLPKDKGVSPSLQAIIESTEFMDSYEENKTFGMISSK